MNHGSFDIWATGIVVVIGGQYFSWNVGLEAGTLSYGIALGLMALAYLCLVLSMAEMTGMMPFAGGAYGLSRCTLGFYMGFILGCCEAMEYIIYVTCSFLQMGRMIAKQWPQLVDYQFALWIASYALACVVIGRGGTFFWWWNRALAIVSIGLVVIFCLGSLAYVDLNQPGQSDYAVVGGFVEFMKSSPISAWFFIGIESLNTLSSIVDKPKVIVPKGQVAAMITLIVTGVWIYVVCIYLPPAMPTLVEELSPLNRGYTRMFNLSNETATMLAVPATFATAQGFMLSYANIISAMANSKLFPKELAHLHKMHKTPIYALLFGSIISFGLCFLVYNYALDGIMYNACVIFAFLAYISQCYGYIQLKRRHGSMPRHFHSPVGVFGAVFATLIWTMNLIGIAGFQDDNEVSLVIALGLIAVFSIYYHIYAKPRQTFSDEEQKIMLFVHVSTLWHAAFLNGLIVLLANHNHSKSKRKKKRISAGSNPSSKTRRSSITPQGGRLLVIEFRVTYPLS
ncbi:unnamed protein product [Aphanomyces euteiches]